MGALQLHSISPSLHVCLEPVPSCVHHNPSRALGDLNISQSSPIGKLILKFWHQRVQKRWHHHSQNLLWCVDKGGHRRSVFSDGGGESLSGVRSSSFVRLLPLLQPPQQPILHPTDAISSISSIQKKRKLEEVLNWRSTFISEHLWRLFHFVGFILDQLLADFPSHATDFPLLGVTFANLQKMHFPSSSPGSSY